MPGPVTDPRAYELRERYHAAIGGAELPVPVEAIAADLLGLLVEQGEIDCSGLLVPAERRIVVNAGEPPPRRRFTPAHEPGHWVCQVLEGQAAPVSAWRVGNPELTADRAGRSERNLAGPRNDHRPVPYDHGLARRLRA